MKVFIVDDDAVMIVLQTKLLESAGHTVESSVTSVDVLDRIEAFAPDGVIVDIMMPNVDGLTLCRQMRARPAFSDVKVVVVSGKPFEHDKKRAFDLGADAFINKPIDPSSFAAQIEKLVADRIVMDFWGVRGTLPVPGAASVRYGGNTSCVSLEFPSGQFFIFDAGSGIKCLGDRLRAAGRKRITAKIFISHPHYDHINALPFFSPLYDQGNDFEIIGAAHAEKGMKALISAQMDDVYFPITIREFGAHVYFTDLTEGEFDIGGIKVSSLLLSHPGNCLGYRVDYQGRSICYITDNEMFPDWTPYHNARYFEQLSGFVAGADVLITDATYTDEEYRSKVTWGHSCVSEVARLAADAQAKTLYLYHHDPGQSDEDIDAKLETERRMLTERGSATECVAPCEGQQFKI